MYEGDRFKVEENDYYEVITSLDTAGPLPTYCILDEEEGGYIAFTTSKKEALRITHALAFSTKPSDYGYSLERDPLW